MTSVDGVASANAQVGSTDGKRLSALLLIALAAVVAALLLANRLSP